MGDSLPRTPLNYCAEFDTASFILVGEIRNCTNKKHKQTVNDISTLCLSAFVDNKVTSVLHGSHLVFRVRDSWRISPTIVHALSCVQCFETVHCSCLHCMGATAAMCPDSLVDSGAK